MKSNNALIGAKRIQKKYGVNRVNIIGIKKTDAIYRELIYDIYNLDTEFITKKFGKITISQFNCLACRLAMYIVSIIICSQNKIKKVIDGARKCQLFAIEQPEFLNIFRMLFSENNLTIEYPLVNENNDFLVKNLILARGFVPKMNETQCLIGMSITENGMNNEILNGLITIYNNNLHQKIYEILDKYKKIQFGGEYL